MFKYALSKYALCFSLFCVFLFPLNAETQEKQQDINISPALIFHNMGRNMLHSVTYNYGLNFGGAALGTWGFVATGLDWEWRNVCYNNQWLPSMGLPLLFAGYIVPVITPIPVYLAGRHLSDTKLQITAVALAQSLALSQITQVSLKMLTGRSIPGVISGVSYEPKHFRDPRTDDFSGEFNWFTFNFYDGWPSGHVVSAFSAAACIAEIYDDKTLLKVGVYTYAFLMGFSVAANAHWASESFAGALMGYAIGKTVGKSFNKLLGKNDEPEKVSPFFTANTVGVLIRI